MASQDVGEGDPEGQDLRVMPEVSAEAMPAVLALARLLAGDIDSEAALPLALAGMLRAVDGAETGAVFLCQPGAARLVSACALGYDCNCVRDMSLRPNEGIVGVALASGKPLLLKTAEETSRANAQLSRENRECMERAMRRSVQPSSSICVPLLLSDAAAGAVVLETWGEQAFSKSHLEMAEALAGLVSMYLDRRHLADEAHQRRRVMRDVSQLQQDIMASLSHEMRTPLASIKGYASALLLDDVAWQPERVREYLDIIIDEADELGEIVTDLLDASVIDGGHLAIEKEPTLIAKLAHRVVQEIEPRTEKHRFLVSFPARFPVVDADAGRIRRVFHNLLDNAVKYSPDGGLIVVRAEVSEQEVTISIADQGQGIAPEHLNRLFERFFRVKFATGRHVVGSGLGLPIVRNIVEAHGGRIWAESNLGEGTTVTFTLPRGGLSDAAQVEGD